MTVEMLKPAPEPAGMTMKRNFVWTWLGNVIYLGTQWALLVILTKLGTIEVVGQFFMGMAVTAPVIIFSQMQLRQALVTDTSNAFHLLDYFIARLIHTLVALGGVILWLWCMQYPGQLKYIVLLIAISKGIESLSDIMHGKFQKNNRMDYIAISMITRGTLTLPVFGYILSRTGSLASALLSMIVVWTGVVLCYDTPHFIQCARNECPGYRWRASKFFMLCRTAFPLSLASGLTSFSGNIPRYYLQYFFGKEAVGLFSVAAVPLNFITSIQMALGNTVMGRAAVYYQTGKEKEFSGISRKTTIASLATSIFFFTIFLFWGKELMTILFSSTYASAVPALVVMSAGTILSGFRFYGSLVSHSGRMFNLQLINMVLVVVLQGIVGFFLVSRWSFLGAAWLEFGKSFFYVFFFWWVGAKRNRFTQTDKAQN